MLIPRTSLPGHATVLMITVTVLLVSALTTFVTPFLLGATPSLVSVGRFLLTVALCWQLYVGRPWARIVSIVLLSLGGIISLVAGILWIAMITPMFGVLMVLLAVVYLGAAVTLGVSAAVRRYFTGGGK